MEESRLEVERHVKYWQRCLRSLLPTQYTSTDSSRMTFAFFILSALDLLGVGPDTFSDEERVNIRNWILKCQHPNGGFCGSPNHRFPDIYYADVGNGVQQMDPANLNSTYFALMSLSFVGDFEHIKRDACLKWLKTLQRGDGSFGELLTEDGIVEGGRDMRYCYTATAIRWILRGDKPLSEEEKKEDIDVEKLVGHIRSGQTYDGGISESSLHEAHAGYTYCAISALSLLNRLPGPLDSGPGLTDIPSTIRWLISRQVGYSPEEGEGEGESEQMPQEQQKEMKDMSQHNPLPSVILLHDKNFVGFNGRCNKRVDTCYAFWVTAALDVLGQDKAQLVNAPAIRRFLFEQTQHRIGGFGKTPGDVPDIYHSYLGIAVLATMNEAGIRPLDPALCVSKKQKEIINQLRSTASIPTRTYWKDGFCFSIWEDDPDLELKMASSEKPPEFVRAAAELVIK